MKTLDRMSEVIAQLKGSYKELTEVTPQMYTIETAIEMQDDKYSKNQQRNIKELGRRFIAARNELYHVMKDLEFYSNKLYRPIEI